MVIITEGLINHSITPPTSQLTPGTWEVHFFKVRLGILMRRPVWHCGGGAPLISALAVNYK